MTVKDSLMTIEDFRIDRCKKRKLVDILMIVFFGLFYADIKVLKKSTFMRN